MQSHLELGEAEARLAIEACAAELRRRNKVGSIAVGDRHGELIALLRMDSASLPSAGIAANKVFTSSRLRQPSGALGRAALAEGWDVHYHGDVRYLGWDGGAPVFYRDECVGSVAVSGLTGVEDLEIAEIGVNAILATLD
jgi:glc operon protein GlcG